MNNNSSFPNLTNMLDKHTQNIGDVLVSSAILHYDSEKVFEDGSKSNIKKLQKKLASRY